MLTLRTTFNRNGELIAVDIHPADMYSRNYDAPPDSHSFDTNCPEMRTALTVACAWERTGHKQ